MRSGIFVMCLKQSTACPVYYGGDLYNLDESEWEDPYNLAYAVYVDQYNFDALEGMSDYRGRMSQ